MKEESPLTVAYVRLDEAHRAWHSALDGYHRIDDFRAGVNSAIQSFRNLTFALQKQKDCLQDFDSWYAGWQIKMGNDPILKALHTARIVIVHQEDLKLKSTAIARTKGWVDFEKIAFEFNPMEDSETIAEGFYNNYAKHLPVSEEIKKRLIFEFERKWVYDKLQDHELLEALAHAYKFLYELLSDAQQKFSLPIKENYSTGAYCSADFTDEHILNCMTITKQERSLIYSFSDGKQYNLIANTTTAPPTNEIRQLAQQRYGDDWESEENLNLIKGVFSKEYPFNIMDSFAKVAITALKKDKFLIPMTFIFTKKGNPPVMITHTFKDQESKVISINRTANETIKHRGEYIFHLGEVWTANFDESRPDMPAWKREDKKELIQFAYMSAEKGCIISIPFHKNDNEKIVFGKTSVEDFLTNENHRNYIFLPLIDALKKVESS